MKNRKQNGWEILGKMLAVVAALIVSAIVRGVVFKIMWNWFVVRLGVAAISLPEALGLAMIISMVLFREESPDDKRNATAKFVTAFSVGIMGAAFVLFFGWIVHLFL